MIFISFKFTCNKIFIPDFVIKTKLTISEKLGATVMVSIAKLDIF